MAGPSLLDGRGCGALGRACGVGLGAAAVGVGVTESAFGWAAGAGAAGWLAVSVVGAEAFGFGVAAGLAAGLAGAAGSVASFSFTLRTTGASIVDDAERTNSPIPFRVDKSSLLSSPSSLASS